MTIKEQLRREEGNAGARPYKKLTPISTFADVDFVETGFPSGTTMGWATTVLSRLGPYNSETKPASFRFVEIPTVSGVGSPLVVDDIVGAMVVNDPARPGDPKRILMLPVDSAAKDLYEYNFDTNVFTSYVLTDDVSSDNYIFNHNNYVTSGLKPGQAFAYLGHTGTSVDIPFTGSRKTFLAYRDPVTSQLNFLVNVGGTTTIVTGLITPAAGGLYRYQQDRKSLFFQALLVNVKWSAETDTNNKLVVRTTEGKNEDLILGRGTHVIPIEVIRLVSKGSTSPMYMG